MGKKLFLMLLAFGVCFSVINETKAGVSTYVYDEQGRLIRAPFSGGDIIYTYDSNGSKTSERGCRQVAADGSCPSYYYGEDYTYDSNGNKTSSRYCGQVAANGSCSSYSSGTDYTYDSNGNQTSSRPCSQVAADGSCAQYSDSRKEYTYDSNGNQTSYRHCDQVAADGSCSSYSGGDDYTYDANGNQTSYRSCSQVAADGSCAQYSDSRTEYTYDSNGNQTSYRHCNRVAADGSCLKYSSDGWEYTYDSNGNKTSSRQCNSVAADGSCSSYSYGEDYTYDSNGNETSYRQCNSVAADGSCSSYYYGNDYTYDSNGNQTSLKTCNQVAADGSCYSYGNDYTYNYDEFGNVINGYKNGVLDITYTYPPEYYNRIDQECSDAGNCKVCSQSSTLENGKCVPWYEWLDDETLIISDVDSEITRDIFGLSSGMPEKILCRGDVTKCKEKLRNYPIYFGGGNSYGFGSSGDPYGYSAPSGGEYLGVDLGDYIEPATEANCETSKYYWSGSSCNNKSGGINCEENFKQMETWCNRIRYTPAEAAKVLKDTDNEVVMTFKVNR